MNVSFDQFLWVWIGLLVVAFLAWLLRYSQKRSEQRMHKFAASHLVKTLTSTFSNRRLWIKNTVILLAVFSLFLTASRPQLGSIWEKNQTQGIDLMFALDTSRSMLAEDIAPNRLERSRLAILDLLQKVRGDRVGLIAFAGSAFLQCPLTLDYQAFRNTLSSMDTETIPIGGTDISAAISEAEAYFQHSDNFKVLILITDGEDLEASGILKAQEASEKGILIYTIGVGSREGELVPITDENGSKSYLRDASGNLVKSSLDEETLQKIAAVTNGLYSPLGPTGAGLDAVYQHSLSRVPSSKRTETLQRIPIERFQWPLFLAIALLLIESLIGTRKSQPSKKKEVITISLFFALLALSQTNDLSASTKLQAQDAFQNGKYEESVTLYRQAIEENPYKPILSYNLGVAAYRAGQFQDAIAAFNSSLRTADTKLQEDAFFNLGNSRVQAGFKALVEEPAMAESLWKAALTDFENAYALNENASDSLQNKEKLLDLINSHSYQLSLKAEPEEGGTLKGDGLFFNGVPTPITAMPNDGWRFEEWTGAPDGAIDDVTSETATLSTDNDVTLIGSFIKTWYLQVDSDDAKMGMAGKSGTYDAETPVPVKAESEDYFAFSKWTTESTNISIEQPEAAETNVTLTGDGEIKANFVPAFKLSVVTDPAEGGPAGPSGFFEEYSTVPITAKPRDGFEWVKWIGDGIEDHQKPETTITLTEDRIAIAEMKRIWNLVLIPQPEEGGQVSGGCNDPIGTIVNITAEAAEGYQFEEWQGPGVADPQNPETSVTIQSSEHNVFAIFSKTDQDGNEKDDSQDQSKQQEQKNNQDSQKSQEEQKQDQDQSGENENQKNESQDNQESSGEEEQNSQSANDTEQKEGDELNEESKPKEGEDSQNQKAEEQVVPGQMTREAARQLLNSIQESEKVLPASKEQGQQTIDDARRGRNW